MTYFFKAKLFSNTHIILNNTTHTIFNKKTAQLLIQHDQVIWFTISPGWGPISTLHSLNSDKGKKKKSRFNLLCAQLLPVNTLLSAPRQIISHRIREVLLWKKGGGCCTHISQSCREIQLHQQVKMGRKEGVRQGNLWPTWLHQRLQTRPNQLTSSILVYISVVYVSLHVTPEKKKETRLFFALDISQVENTPFSPPPLVSMVSHSLISTACMFSHQVTWWGECCCFWNCWSCYSLIKSTLAQNTS